MAAFWDPVCEVHKGSLFNQSPSFCSYIYPYNSGLLPPYTLILPACNVLKNCMDPVSAQARTTRYVSAIRSFRGI